ncbi:hypothetical protein BCM02_107302 [Paenibacillus methanolicus]|uniref:Uncharacterized protein n=1 Tax=Paenibacillus methanolicus TaxID=582686 RepID=A0A5S5C3X5_9BACL|nr:hypothetical protein BCM02_107302 [Paenibacillus methanolicus]
MVRRVAFLIFIIFITSILFTLIPGRVLDVLKLFFDHRPEPGLDMLPALHEEHTEIAFRMLVMNFFW